jgi:hypothetical protein
MTFLRGAILGIVLVVTTPALAQQAPGDTEHAFPTRVKSPALAAGGVGSSLWDWELASPPAT